MEVDCIIDRKSEREWIEIKKTHTFKSSFLTPMEALKPPEEKGYLLYNGKQMPYLEKISILPYKVYLQ